MSATAAPFDDTALMRILNGLVERPQIKHAVVSIESGDGMFRWGAAAGNADQRGTPMQHDTPYFLASITKLYVAVTVLKLWERGLVSLETPFTHYLPAELTDGLHRLSGVDHTDRITVMHLLGHTSGLPDWLEDYPKRGTSLIERIFAGEDRVLGIDVVADVVRTELRPHFEPQPLSAGRVRVRYSDTNFQLLMAIIEQVTGKRLGEVYAEYIFRPLSLVHTWYPGEAPLAETKEAATTWVGARPLDRPMALASVGDLYATASDTIHFLRAVVDGSVFDKADTASVMYRQWNRFSFPFDRAALRSPGWPIEYGAGIMRLRLPRLLTPFSTIPAVVGHTGSTGSWLFHAPEPDLYLAGTVDQATAGAVPYRTVPRLLRAVASARRK